MHLSLLAFIFQELVNIALAMVLRDVEKITVTSIANPSSQPTQTQQIEDSPTGIAPAEPSTEITPVTTDAAPSASAAAGGGLLSLGDIHEPHYVPLIKAEPWEGDSSILSAMLQRTIQFR